jgi:hypothetical protein
MTWICRKLNFCYFRTVTGEPKSLNCTTGSNLIKYGQPLSSEIHVIVRDKYGNDIQHVS